MASSIDVAIDQQGIEPINMDDDMMSEYYNTTTTIASNDDHSMMMMMMEEAEQEPSNLIADTILNDDDEIASVSNEVIMEEDGNNNNDTKVHEDALFASTSYPHSSIPADVEIEHSIGVDLPDETIGDAVYEVEESDHTPSVNAIVAEQEESEEKGNTTFDQTERPEAGQIAKESEEITVPETEHGTLDSNDEYATEGQLSESRNDGEVNLSEKAEITEEPVNNDAGESLVVKEEQITTQDEATEDGQEAHISTSSVRVEQNVENDVESHSSAQLNPIRVTFDGQDFVLYPDEEPSTFISINHERVQAPTLSVEAKVFSEPLETLFEALRIREVLGDFLDEGTELCLTFHDLDMIAREDDIYIREVTLDDIQRLHSGLGYTSSMHINVSESQRFISRYNDLANQVSVLIEQKTENESIEQGKVIGEQSIEPSVGDAGLEIVNGEITASSKEEAAGKSITEVEVERNEEGEEEVDQDEEDTFVTVTNDEDNDEEQYVESYEEGGEMHNQSEGDEDVKENTEEDHHPKQLHFFSVQVAPAETDEDPVSVQEEPKLEIKTEEETYNEQLTEKVEDGNEESTIKEKDSSRDTGTTLSENGEEAEEQIDPDYEPAEEVDAVNEEEGAEEDFQGIEEAYEDYEEEEEEGGQEEPFDDDDDDNGEEEDVEKAELGAEEVYDNENDLEPQIGSHGQKRQFEDDLEYSTEDLNGEGIHSLEHNEDDSKRARYEEPEKEEA